MASEVTSFIEEANEEEMLERYDNGEDDEWPEETDESESSFSIARIKENRKAGRKSTWSEEVTNDLVDIICEDEYLRKRILFTNIKNAKNQEVYGKVMQRLRDRCEIRSETCIFTISQARNKFKSLVAICKKASLTRQTASGIDNFIQNKGYGKWFGQLFPLVQSRESAQPDQAIEPSMETTEVVIEKGNNKGLYVPRRKRKSEESSIPVDAVSKFNKLLDQDPSETLIKYFKEENDRSREHEERMMQMQCNMQLQMMKMIMGMGKLPYSSENATNQPSFSGHLQSQCHPSLSQFSTSVVHNPLPKQMDRQVEFEKSYYDL